VKAGTPAPVDPHPDAYIPDSYVPPASAEAASYKVKARLLTNRTPLRVAVVGVGGTGSEVISGLIHLHQALVAIGRPGLQVWAFDPDTVSTSNLVRQRYHQQDLGRNKAEVLIRRVNSATGLNWQAISEVFDSNAAANPWDIVLSCVDSRRSRKKLHGYSQRQRFTSWGAWIDFGNDNDRGQVIWGDPGPRPPVHALPCATTLHPDLIDMTLPEDTTPSCSTLQALTRQGLMMNKTVSTLGLQMLWDGLSTGRLIHHGWYFNFTAGIFKALDVPQKPVKVKRDGTDDQLETPAPTPIKAGTGKAAKKKPTSPKAATRAKNPSRTAPRQTTQTA